MRIQADGASGALLLATTLSGCVSLSHHTAEDRIDISQLARVIERVF
jgi:hypothetical protein